MENKGGKSWLMTPREARQLWLIVYADWDAHYLKLYINQRYDEASFLHQKDFEEIRAPQQNWICR